MAASHALIGCVEAIVTEGKYRDPADPADPAPTGREGESGGADRTGEGQDTHGVRRRQEPPPLKPGDTVALSVEGIGTVSGTVVEGAAPVPLQPARRRVRERP